MIKRMDIAKWILGGVCVCLITINVCALLQEKFETELKYEMAVNGKIAVLYLKKNK